MTVDNIAGSIEALLKDADGLVETIQKASQSCCNLSINNPNEKDSKPLFDEASNYVNELHYTPDREVFGGISAFYDRLFIRFAQRASPAAEALERCLAERSAKDRIFETDAATKQKTTLDKIRSLLADPPKKN